ncbi:hypothetical protein ABZT03_08850 [Streptomyces sp. NPDC005574]|uniref:hypothetical protein n=1 Tax=Streptomyces sp. NPDC005574 TaxID=3156891 RepID=UPI0033B7C84A
MTTPSTSRTPTRHAPLPVVRAAVFALVGTVLGVSAHHVVTEASMPWRHGAAAAAVLFAVGLVGARRRRSTATVVAVCGAAQLGLHALLSTTHAHDSHAVRSGGLGEPMPAHTHHAMNTHPVWHGRLHDSLTMSAVHVAAAVLVAVLLHRADTACWSLARGLTHAVDVVDAARARIATAWALLTWRAAPASSGVPALVPAWLDRPPFRVAVCADVVVRRGPPWAGLTPAI